MRNLVTIKDNPLVRVVNYIYDYQDPQEIYIPILNKSTFKMYDYIYKNTYLGDSIVSISGKIVGSKKVFYQNNYVPALKIKNDFKENTTTKKRRRKINNKEELINTLEKYHLNNIIEKLNKDADSLIISSIDEEIYSLKEFMRLATNYNEILETINELLRILNISSSLIAIKNTNSKSIQNVKSIIGTYPFIKIKLVPDNYLISYPKFLCEYLNFSEDKTIILTSNDIYDIYNVLYKAKNISETLVTLSGDVLEKSLIINTRIGVSLEELTKKYLNILSSDYDIYLNGYLKGIKVNDLKDIIITKDIDSVVFKLREESLEEECINCGACQKICPFKINVKKCYFKGLNHKLCIGCGLCNFVCPANIDLRKVVRRDSVEEENN